MLSEEREKWKEENNALEKQLIQLNTADQYSQWLSNIIISEMMPGLVRKYGIIPERMPEIIVEERH